LLRGITIDRPNQVWAMDITCIPMARGFEYLAEVVDWHSHRVLAWRFSITMDARSCLDALQEARDRHGAPESSTSTKSTSSPRWRLRTC